MEKLHDKLRIFSNAAYAVDIDCFMDVVNADSTNIRDIALAIANEIERTYIPLPVDENGEPWRIGQKCIFDEEPGIVAGVDDQGSINVYNEECECWTWIDSSYVHRPKKDTLECINDDASKNPIVYCVEHKIKLHNENDIKELSTAFVRDLLKRQREVLERDK